MLNNKMVVKFKFEKNSLNFELNVNNTVHVLFYSEKNLLPSNFLENHKNLSEHLKKIMVKKSFQSDVVRFEDDSNRTSGKIESEHEKNNETKSL